MQKFFFNSWTDESLSEFCASHARDNYRENYQDIDGDGGYYLICQNGDSFEIRHWRTSNWTSITIVWVNNKLARLIVKEWE